MSSSRRHKSNRHDTAYPTEWSEWMWTEKWTCWMRFRERARDDYEHEYDTEWPAPETGSRAQTNPEDNVTNSIPSTQSLPASTSQHNSDYPNYTFNTTASSSTTAEYHHINQQSAATVTNLGSQTLDSRFKVLDKPSRFFSIGRVFKVLWTEPAGENGPDADGLSYSDIGYGQKSFTKVRRFVVIQKRLHSSLCLAISTYGGRGTRKRGLRSEDHAIVYAYGKGRAPRNDPRDKLMTAPIPIRIEQEGETLSEDSRLDFGRVYTVEHNVKVLKVGRVHEGEIKRVKKCFANTISIGSDEASDEIDESRRGGGHAENMPEGTSTVDSYTGSAPASNTPWSPSASHTVLSPAEKPATIATSSYSSNYAPPLSSSSSSTPIAVNNGYEDSVPTSTSAHTSVASGNFSNYTEAVSTDPYASNLYSSYNQRPYQLNPSLPSPAPAYTPAPRNNTWDNYSNAGNNNGYQNPYSNAPYTPHTESRRSVYPSNPNYEPSSSHSGHPSSQSSRHRQW